MLITCPKCSIQYKIPSEIKLSEGKKVQCSACQHIFEFHPEIEEITEKTPLLPPEDAVLSMSSRTEKIVVKRTDSSRISDVQQTLPEAFQPLQRQKSSPNIPYFWIILCAILLLGFAFVGWTYRNSLLFGDHMAQSVHFDKSYPIKRSKRSRPVSVHPGTPVKPADPVVITIPAIAEKAPVSDEALSPAQPNDSSDIQVPVASLAVQSVRFRKTPTGEAVLIEGMLKNTTSETLPVPEKIYALAYNPKGTLIFEKEIYLPKGILYPDMEQPFFGTYAPVTEEIQWVDVVLKK